MLKWLQIIWLFQNSKKCCLPNNVCKIFTGNVALQKTFNRGCICTAYSNPVAIPAICEFSSIRNKSFFCCVWEKCLGWFVYHVFVFCVCCMCEFCALTLIEEEENRSIEREDRERKMPAWESSCQIDTLVFNENWERGHTVVNDMICLFVIPVRTAISTCMCVHVMCFVCFSFL